MPMHTRVAVLPNSDAPSCGFGEVLRPFCQGPAFHPGQPQLANGAAEAAKLGWADRVSLDQPLDFWQYARRAARNLAVDPAYCLSM